MVTKIIDYENASGAMDRVVLAADENEGYDFETSSSGLTSFLPEGIDSQEIFRGLVGSLPTVFHYSFSE